MNHLRFGTQVASYVFSREVFCFVESIDCYNCSKLEEFPSKSDVSDDDELTHIACRVNFVSRLDWSKWVHDASWHGVMPSWGSFCRVVA